MKTLILLFAICLIYGCSPTKTEWYTGNWYAKDADSWHLIASKSTIWVSRHINHSPTAAIYSCGALNDQRSYLDSVCSTPVDTAGTTYAIDITKVGDSLELTGQYMQPVYFTR